MMFSLLLLLSVEVFPILSSPMEAPGMRAIRSTGCDAQYASLSSSHTMCLTDVGTEDTLSASDKQAIVDKHNYYRSNVSPTATNLVKLVWDDDIAVIAAKWARQCGMAHDSYTNKQVPNLPGVSIGQNLAAGYSSVVTATTAWHDEVDYFRYGVGNTTMREVGHYTQVVGWRAVRIGCGQASCTGTKYSKYQVCNYAWGQYSPEFMKPYTNGTSCSDCPTGKCSDNLCDCGGRVCLNGGTLDSKTCTCSCPGVCHGDTCEKSVTAIRSTGCDAQYASLSSSHTMCLTDVGTEDTLSASDKQAIVDKHNYYRSNVSPTATNLVKLVWDDDIAVIAAKWARQCVMAHDSYTNKQVPNLPGVSIGQNLAAGYSSVVTATTAWHDEVNYFGYGVGNTSMMAVGHYTQVVGWRAVRIGCGQATCTGTKYQACNYAWGQYSPELKRPYTNGTSCSDCPTGKCSDNLCDCGGRVCLNGGNLDSKTCTCSCPGVYHGDACEENCNGKTCLNGGTLQIPACTCSCPGIFYGDTCQNVSCPTSESGWCTTVNYCPQAWFFQYCPMLCDICDGPAACPNKQCQNGAELQEDCTCNCYDSYSGDLCQNLICPSSDPWYCGKWPGSYCDTNWNVPFQCPKKCGKC